MSNVNQPPTTAAPIAASKPVEKSAEFVIWGVVFSYVIAPLIVALTVPNMFTYSLYGGSRVAGGAVVALLFAGAIALVGVITLLVGVARALNTVDRLGQAVLVSEQPTPVVVAPWQHQSPTSEQG